MTDTQIIPGRFYAHSYSPVVHGAARHYSGNYRGHRVVQAGRRRDGIPTLSTNCRDVRVVRDRGGLYYGTTMASAGRIEEAICARLADHLNLLADVRAGFARITLARIADEQNAELQRELIEAYDGSAAGIEQPPGWDTYLADVQAASLHQDETGELIEIATAAEPIRAVRVTCPSTGRQYALRVPPKTATAREGVAWTFGVAADEYRPTAQS